MQNGADLRKDVCQLYQSGVAAVDWKDEDGGSVEDGAEGNELMCRKRQYFIKRAAEFFASADGMRSYFCHLCQCFHLTSQLKRKTKLKFPWGWKRY